MLAEIHNKISQTGSNLSDRLEDKLTGDFFGAIRYVPFEHGLKHVLSTVDYSLMTNSDKWLKSIEKLQGYIMELEFWKKDDEGEIDLFLSDGDAIIGIEVKYLSGLSTEDQETEIPIEYTESVNQLSRYSRMLDKLSDGRDAYLLFLAPFEMMNTVKKNMMTQPVTSPNVELGFLCWEDILESLKGLNINHLEKGHQLIIQDLQALLTKKGLSRFYGFNGEIYNQTILEDSYTFTCERIQEENWNWPTKIIRKDDGYVYIID